MSASAPRRFLTQLRLDVTQQWRNGFYLVSLLVVVPSVLFLRLLPDPVLAWVLPLVLFQNTFINTFFFVAGLVLLERDEGSLAAQAVAPLREAEYLGAKVLTLAALATAEGLAIAHFAFDGRIVVWQLFLGQLSAAVILALLGLAVITRYRTINEFLMPAVVVTVVLCLPMLRFLGMLPAWLLAIHPLEPSMRALVAAFAPPSAAPGPWLLGSLPWLILAVVVARRRFRFRQVGGAT